ncbi:hypothetical protein F4825DRAFT_184322 [Nemania diffusa]|nr:hypothetical protein F4825DRAFT_184322 [Nemania diffusa]
MFFWGDADNVCDRQAWCRRPKEIFKTPQKHHGAKRKREQQSESGSDDEEYEPPEKVPRKSDNPSSSRRYACLWFKRYPRKHFACGQFSFAKISHVMQHLRRTHREAVCYCPICGDNFQTSTNRDVHIRAQECQRRDFEFDTIPADRWDVIDDISRRNSRTSDQKWNDIYKTLFGEASPLPDPWYIDPYKEAARMFERLISANTSRLLNALEASSGRDSMCAVNRPTTEAVSVFRTVLCETVTDHLASEEEPPSRPSSMPVPYVPSASQAEALAQDSIWNTGENVSAISSQLQRAGVQTSALATGRVEELHGLDHQTIRMNPMQYNDVVTQESIAPLFNFTEYPGDFFRILNNSTPYTIGTP